MLGTHTQWDVWATAPADATRSPPPYTTTPSSSWQSPYTHLNQLIDPALCYATAAAAPVIPVSQQPGWPVPMPLVVQALDAPLPALALPGGVLLDAGDVAEPEPEPPEQADSGRVAVERWWCGVRRKTVLERWRFAVLVDGAGVEYGEEHERQLHGEHQRQSAVMHEDGAGLTVTTPAASLRHFIVREHENSQSPMIYLH